MISRPNLLFLLVLFSCTLKGYSNDKKEIDRLLADFDSNHKSFNETIIFLNGIDSMSRAINYEHGIFEAHLGLSYTERTLNVENAWESTLIMDSLYEKDPTIYSDTLTIQYFLVKGYLFGTKNDPLNELEMYNIADSIAILKNNDYFKSIVNFSFTNYYNYNNQFEKALAYNTKVIAYYKNEEESPQQKFSYLTLLNNSGIIHYSLANYDSSIYYANLCIDGGFETFGFAYDPYTLIGKSYLKKNNISEAKKYADIARTPLFTIPKYSSMVFDHQLLTGEIYTQMNQLDSAYVYLISAREIADSIHLIRSAGLVEKALFEYGVKKYNCPELNEYFNNYDAISNQVFDEAIEKKEKQLLIQFETVQKEKEIIRLNRINQLEKTKNIIILFSLISILFILILLIYRYSTRKKLFIQQERNHQLSHQIMHSKLNNALNNIREKVNVIADLETKLTSSNAIKGENLERLTLLLNEGYINETKWNEVIHHFDQLNGSFSQQLKANYNTISKNEIKLLILIKMGFLNKEIAAIKNISINGVKKAKQRLRQKLQISDFSELEVWENTSLNSF